MACGHQIMAKKGASWVAIGIFWGILIGASKLIAAPITEKVGNGEVDWAALKLQFSGYSDPVSEAASSGFKESEKQAWKSGVGSGSALLKSVIERLAKKDGRSQLFGGEGDANQVIKSSMYSVNTTYFANGVIRVDFEVPLAKAIRLGQVGVQSLPGDGRSPSHSAVVIKCRGNATPDPFYGLTVDGKVVFDYRYINKADFDRNLSGRWLKKPKAKELAGVSGDNPLILEGKIEKEGEQISLQQKDWAGVLASGDAKLFSEGRIVFVVE